MSHVLRVQRLSVLVDLVRKLRSEGHKDDQIMLVLEDYIDRNYASGYTKIFGPNDEMGLYPMCDKNCIKI